ncbi:diacylglycerol kinase family lipid kinase [Lactobacillus crispatus]|jgi:lipid kinase, YegS/Rv2252/BmrU family|uniref:Diacylglycerol kinase family lipid kinase n=1 Tax=Lactobacillus crispatus TaxID=47770 RepID=A0A135YM25_9LACO|nr:diacylglycerol kinase family lipid kinase [Lactobacillus crispatus]STX17105.1 putative lipid kinase [Lactobacillus acidophilus]EEJ70816.1 lipid kinase, YegS/Rv2252/BmrU family [Lactobacillus crispatus JV-V01]EEU27573.1 YegS//BmrU family lipid kinase [Lactobacillus crispatus MV-1A-US]KWU05480.1 lipid kinase [Lactobacillus crispatus]KWU12730.1 lipid kinase [Lactobacillus crispatus]
MTRKARLIYNPVSGHEQMPKNVADILDVLEQAGYEASAFRTTPEENSARNEATRAAKEGFDLIVAAGGDGTINEVVNGIAFLENRPKMAIIPAGTTNDYARALAIPRDNIPDAAKVILKNKTRKMDIGKAVFGDKIQYFVNIAASGSLTELTYGVPSEVKSALGYAAYLIKGAEMLPHLTENEMRLTYDDGVYEGKLSMFLLGMTNSIGGFEQVMPDAQLSDGLFQLIVVKPSDPVSMMKLMALALNGKHVDDPNIIYTKTRSLKAELIGKSEGQDLPVNLDGEIGGYCPVEFNNLQQHIEFYVGG